MPRNNKITKKAKKKKKKKKGSQARGNHKIDRNVQPSSLFFFYWNIVPLTCYWLLLTKWHFKTEQRGPEIASVSLKKALLGKHRLRQNDTTHLKVKEIHVNPNWKSQHVVNNHQVHPPLLRYRPSIACPTAKPSSLRNPVHCQHQISPPWE